MALLTELEEAFSSTWAINMALLAELEGSFGMSWL
jgi:hypothetical protein